MKTLISERHVYRVDERPEGEALIAEYKSKESSEGYTTKKSGLEYKTKKSKGEIIEDWYICSVELAYDV